MAHYRGDFKPHYFDLRRQPELYKYRMQTAGGTGTVNPRATMAVAAGSVAVAAVMFFTVDKMIGQPVPHTMSAEWKAAEAKQFAQDNTYAIRQHKVGRAAVQNKQVPLELQDGE